MYLFRYAIDVIYLHNGMLLNKSVYYMVPQWLCIIDFDWSSLQEL